MMLVRPLLLASAVASFVSTQCGATELAGPARFCGYAPIIDLRRGEKVTTLDGGIHGGSFRWEGPFGSLTVRGIGWASRPDGLTSEQATNSKPARSAPRRVEGEFETAIWNGAHGAAYFRSPKPFTALQLEAIDRVMLHEEGEAPTGCNLRTMFSWD